MHCSRLYAVLTPVIFAALLCGCIPSKPVTPPPPPAPEAQPSPASPEPAAEPMTPATANTGEASVASQLSMSIEDAGKGIPTGVRIEKQPDADIYTVLGKIGEVGTLTATIMPVEGAENQWELLGKMVFSQDKYAAGNVDAMVMPDISIDSEGGKIQSTLVMFSLPITLPPASVATSPANLEFPVSARFTAPRPVQFTFSFSAS